MSRTSRSSTPNIANTIAISAIAAAGVFMALSAQGQTPSLSNALPVYASVGPELAHYELDEVRATLTKRDSVTLPQNVHYAWPHPSRRYLYVVWSDGAGGIRGTQHGLSAFTIDPRSGTLRLLGEPVRLAARPIHVTVDATATHVLVAYNDPSSVTVHRLAPDGTIGTEVPATQALDAGIYAHQIRVDASNALAILVARGNGPVADRAEELGALKVFRYRDGVLTNPASIAPESGVDFQPRHLDFHPSKPWVYVSLERQNKLQVYRKLPDGTLGRVPVFTKDSLAAPAHVVDGQAASTIHVHPNGRFVYQGNRATGTIQYEGKAIFAGGENSIAVYAINQDTGEPTLIQNVDSRGRQPRTFALDPGGRILIAANQSPFLVRDGSRITTVPASLAVFRVQSDGKLDFVRKYDVAASQTNSLAWMGILALP
jgi:6-phosphogluconolactonase